VHALDQMVANSGRNPGPYLDLRHSFAKDEASQLIAQLLDLLRIGGGPEAFRQMEECFLFFLLGLDALLDEFHQNAIVAESALPGQGLDLSGDLGRQGYTSPDMFYAG
jgi:hypothetical protein